MIAVTVYLFAALSFFAVSFHDDRQEGDPMPLQWLVLFSLIWPVVGAFACYEVYTYWRKHVHKSRG